MRRDCREKKDLLGRDEQGTDGGWLDGSSMRSLLGIRRAEETTGTVRINGIRSIKKKRESPRGTGPGSADLGNKNLGGGLARIDGETVLRSR